MGWSKDGIKVVLTLISPAWHWFVQLLDAQLLKRSFKGIVQRKLTGVETRLK
jgi:hypothetical protein